MAQDTAETISATITVTNSEACLISAMLTSGDKDTIATITDKLDPADFANTLLCPLNEGNLNWRESLPPYKNSSTTAAPPTPPPSSTPSKPKATATDSPTTNTTS